jgi:hypothetical protein
MSSLKRIDRSLVGVVGTLFAFSMLAIGLTPSANADTVYTYTGSVFDSFKGNSECPPECRITGSFTLEQPLSANLTFVTIFPLSFSFTDGAITLTKSNSLPTLPSLLPLFMEFSTDATGAITSWDVRIQGKQSVGFRFLASSSNPFGPAEDITRSLTGDSALITNDPGTWSVMTTSTPEPNSMFLLVAGLVSLCIHSATQKTRFVKLL